jgi:hypothetical protein
MCKGAASSYKGFLLLLDTDDKVLYNYPAGGPLLDARGLFLTLTQFFDDMFGSQPRRFVFKVKKHNYSIKEVLMTQNGPIDFAQSWSVYLKKSN